MIPYICYREEETPGQWRLWLAGNDRAGAFKIAEPVSVTTDDPDKWLEANQEKALDELDNGHGAIIRVTTGQIKQLDRREDVAWEEVRAERNDRLRLLDWTQLSDAPINETGRADYRQLRQQLRDLPGQFDSPYDVVWPE